MQQMDANRIIYAIFSSGCFVSATVLIAASHLNSARRLQQEWHGASGLELYFKENWFMFLLAGLLLLTAAVLAAQALRKPGERAA
jgi:hypothetical protein